MGNYWGWIKNNYKWYAWKYVDNKVKVKLGPFYTIEEAQEASEEYENSNNKLSRTKYKL